MASTHILRRPLNDYDNTFRLVYRAGRHLVVLKAATSRQPGTATGESLYSLAADRKSLSSSFNELYILKTISDSSSLEGGYKIPGQIVYIILSDGLLA